MTSALFGPDGTQLPEPAAVLPDPLVGPGTPGGWTLPALPAAPDADALRQAIAATLAESMATPPTGIPVQPRPSAPQPVAHQRTAHQRTVRQRTAVHQPAAYERTQPQPVLPGYPPQPVMPGYPPPPPGYSPPSVAPPLGRRQPAPHRPAPPPSAPPQGRRRPPAHQRRADRPARNPLIQQRRSAGAGGWVGCLVVLIFVGTIIFSSLQALLDAVLNLVR